MAPRRKRDAAVRSFYEPALDAADRDDLAEALAVEGLDDEIALLRLRLRRAIEANPDDLQLMTKGIEMLVKAVNARYRLSKEAAADLGESLAATLRGIGGQLYPEGFGDG